MSEDVEAAAPEVASKRERKRSIKEPLVNDYTASDLLYTKRLSVFLTGAEFTIRNDKPAPARYADAIMELEQAVLGWMEKWK